MLQKAINIHVYKFYMNHVQCTATKKQKTRSIISDVTPIYYSVVSY